MIIGDHMGSQRLYRQRGGFSSHLYHTVGSTIISSNGVEGKIVEKIEGNSSYDGLPLFSNTSEVYFKRDPISYEIVQARIYSNRHPVADFDWNHEHTNKNGQVFPKGIVHVQELSQDSNGKWTRDNRHARYMNEKEIERYAELLKLANPNIKLRP